MNDEKDIRKTLFSIIYVRHSDYTNLDVKVTLAVPILATEL